MIQHRRRFRDLLVLSYVAFLATCLDPSAVDAGRLVYTMTLQSSPAHSIILPSSVSH